LPRKPIPFFFGSGKWDDEAVMGELRTRVGEELAAPDGVVVIDGSAFPKKILALLLRDSPPSPDEIARVVTRVLRRNEEARIYHGHKAAGTFPPRRSRPNTS
jgi:hypothetical protein